MRELLEPFVAGEGSATSSVGVLTGELLGQLSAYLDLLVRWNARVSLTAIRSPEEMVERHFGESLFTGLRLQNRLEPGAQILDYGSGAGFPGLPMQLLCPELRMTLAESQARKVAFLREAIRAVGATAEVWPRRVEEMPKDRRFSAVALRAVDRMETSLAVAEGRVGMGGWMAVLAGRDAEMPPVAEEFSLPQAEHRRLVLWRPGSDVPRGT
ncbi:MAG TPA: 16S rRNA (guanine(527)-N(7))-methyltransferase RsmG [Acidobacteriaceae bacterium]|jgi:16S rRNA (guanine527-N7)-methyltransferase|nr:16S rRNA (guanine(527)-N(7))-methyltransferase RsmG [Acidobacteriaceae bacterium]